MKLKAILASVIIALNCFVFPNVYAGNEDIKLIDNKKIDNKKIKDYKISLCLWSLIGIPYFYIKSVKYIEEKKRKKSMLL